MYSSMSALILSCVAGAGTGAGAGAAVGGPVQRALPAGQDSVSPRCVCPSVCLSIC